MNLIEARAAELRAEFIADAEEFGFSQEEIATATGADDGCDTFTIQAENEARRALAASRIHNRRAIRVATPRKPATRRAPRRQAKRAAASSGGSDVDGDAAGPWSLDRIDFFFALGALPILSPTFRDRGTGEFARYRGPSILPRMPHVAISVMVDSVFPHTKTSIHWSDATTGLNGMGVAALVSHVLNIPVQEAADRVAHFFAHAKAASGSGRNVARSLEILRLNYVDPHLRRVA